MKLLRFALWNLGIRVCDVVGQPFDAVVARIPWLNERVGACLVLHPHGLLAPYGEIPVSWWDRFGWATPKADAANEVSA